MSSDDSFPDVTEANSIYEMFPVGPQYYAQYFIDGFRSLHAFTIRLEEGLNVLVGPNGSGKTNFIDFLDFLSLFISRGASGATSHLGGLSRVFSQEALKSSRPRLQAHISGLADLTPFAEVDHGRSLFRYEYSVDIRFNKPTSTLYVASESIKFKSAFWPDLAVFVDRTVGTIVLRRRLTDEGVDQAWDVGKRLLTRGERNPLRYRGRTGRAARNRAGIVDEILEAPRLMPDESFLNSRPSFPALDAVRASLSRGRSFNLIPSHARDPDDLSQSPTIDTKGAGLSATLYQMQQARNSEQPLRPSYFYHKFDQESLDTITSWTSLVLPELEDIDVQADAQTGKYLAALKIRTTDGVIKIPLQGASDGTIKWLSFVCLISIHGSLYSLEEPENFLHPKMQTFLVSLIRESLNSKHPGYFILSTHSETIINECQPEELLLFEFRNGSTSVNRLENPGTVREQINRTGFGLGYYYAANAIS